MPGRRAACPVTCLSRHFGSWVEAAVGRVRLLSAADLSQLVKFCLSTAADSCGMLCVRHGDCRDARSRQPPDPPWLPSAVRFTPPEPNPGDPRPRDGGRCCCRGPVAVGSLSPPRPGHSRSNPAYGRCPQPAVRPQRSRSPRPRTGRRHGQAVTGADPCWRPRCRPVPPSRRIRRCRWCVTGDGELLDELLRLAAAGGSRGRGRRRPGRRPAPLERRPTGDRRHRPGRRRACGPDCPAGHGSSWSGSPAPPIPAGMSRS